MMIKIRKNAGTVVLKVKIGGVCAFSLGHTSALNLKHVSLNILCNLEKIKKIKCFLPSW